ncbi:WD repeat domain phosphoinositide-interacting protein 3 [Nowakowskiella sp. JEL0407]|nr:WD repeat domain phosphoinositide-interacting protein 3 [Nowakowskiella sp. JEL0407]
MNLSPSLYYPASDTADGLVFVGFNQDYTCFAAGTESGFRIYNTHPLKEKTRNEYIRGKTPPSTSPLQPNLSEIPDNRNIPDLNTPGGISICEMMYRTNYIALVGGGKNPKFPPNKVVIWDDLKKKTIFELEFRSVVKAVRLRRERIIVVLSNKVYIYSFSSQPQRLFVFETCENDRGLVGLSTSPTTPTHMTATLAFPARTPGQIQIVDLSLTPRRVSISSNSEERDLLTSVSVIPAHSSQLSCLAVSYDGKLVASASDKGTLIRIFDSKSGRRLHELRRGADKADIFSIAFNLEGTRVCIASDKGTVHIFNLTSTSTHPQNTVSDPTDPVSGNRQSSLSFLSPYVPYFSSEWSFAQFSIPSEARCLCAFTTISEQQSFSPKLESLVSSQTASSSQPSSPILPNAQLQSQLSSGSSVIAICSDGSLYRFSFDPRKGGECTRESFHRFFHIEDEVDEFAKFSGSSSFTMSSLRPFKDWKDIKTAISSQPPSPTRSFSSINSPKPSSATEIVEEKSLTNTFTDEEEHDDEETVKILATTESKPAVTTLSDWEDDSDGL